MTADILTPSKTSEPKYERWGQVDRNIPKIRDVNGAVNANFDSVCLLRNGLCQNMKRFRFLQTSVSAYQTTRYVLFMFYFMTPSVLGRYT